MPLREPSAIRTEHERDVQPRWLLPLQCSVERDLQRGRREEVVAAHHLADVHVVVVGDHRQLIRRLADAPERALPHARVPSARKRVEASRSGWVGPLRHVPG